MKDMRINEAEYKLENGEKGKIAVFLYGGSGDPAAHLNLAVSKYVGDNNYYEFIEDHLSNPWMRVIMSDINGMKQLSFYDYIKNRDRKRKLKKICQTNS